MSRTVLALSLALAVSPLARAQESAPAQEPAEEEAVVAEEASIEATEASPEATQQALEADETPQQEAPTTQPW